MSEYQYYEFQAVDRPLTPEAREEMKRLSSRVQLTATSASFVYHYGDFRGNPRQVLAEYFDSMLYITNWGTRQLAFRFPASALNQETVKPYLFEDGITLDEAGDYLILDITFHDEDGGNWGWVEGEGWLSGLVQLREDILQGDFRVLYLGWLKFAQYEYEILEPDEDLPEPPVPPGLGRLSPSLQQFIDFFELDSDLVSAAARASATVKPSETVDLSPLLDQLSRDEMRAFLVRVLRGERYLDIVLSNRLRELAPSTEQPVSAASQRTLRALFETADQVEKERKAAEAREAEVARLKRIEKTAQQASKLWEQVSALILQKQGKAYDEAIAILKDLQDLAKHESRVAEFQEKIQTIQQQYPTLSGLHRRMKSSGLSK